MVHRLSVVSVVALLALAGLGAALVVGHPFSTAQAAQGQQLPQIQSPQQSQHSDSNSTSTFTNTNSTSLLLSHPPVSNSTDDGGNETEISDDGGSYDP